MGYMIYKGRDGGYGIMHASRNGVEGYKRAKKNQKLNNETKEVFGSYSLAKSNLMSWLKVKSDSELYAVYERHYGNVTPKKIKANGCKNKKEYINKIIQKDISTVQAMDLASAKALLLDEFGGSIGGKF